MGKTRNTGDLVNVISVDVNDNAVLSDGLSLNGVALPSSAVFNADSTTKGVLVPRMTASQRNAIASPEIGLIVYQTDGEDGLYQYKDTGWEGVGESLNLYGITQATVDTNSFLVNDGGVIKYRSGDQILSDIGAQPLLVNPVTGTSSAGYVAYWDSANSISGTPSFFWDNVNQRLGVDTLAPLDKFQVGSTGFFGTLRVSGSIGANKGIDITGSNAGAWDASYAFRGPSGTRFGGLWVNANNDTINYYTVGSASNAGLTVNHSTGNVSVGSTIDNGYKIQSYGNLYVSGFADIQTISQAVTNTNKFLVSDGGIVKYRTAAELLSDVQAVPSSRTITINGTSYDLSDNRSWSVGDTSIYNTNGTLTGNRVVTLDANQLVFRTNQSTLQNYTFTVGTPTGVTPSTWPSSVIYEGEYLMTNSNQEPYNTRVWGRNQGGTARSFWVNQVFADTTAESTGAAWIYNQYFKTSRGSTLDTSTASTNMLGVGSYIGHSYSGSSLTSAAILSAEQTAYLSVTHNNTGSVTNAYGYRARYYQSLNTNSLSSTVTNFYAFYSDATLGLNGQAWTATLTNFYGLFISEPVLRTNGVITNRWGVYAPDGSMRHYINGNVLLGSTTDTGLAKLQVTGAIQQNAVVSSLIKTDASGVFVSATAGTDYVIPSSLTSYVPTSRTITINGTAYDLSADRSWTVTATSNNIYNTDGTLTGNRTVTNDAYTLTIKNTSNTSAALIVQNTQTYGTGSVFTQYTQQWLTSTGSNAGYVIGDIGRLVMTSTIQAPQFYTGGTGFVNNGAGWGGSLGVCGSPIDFGTNTYAGGGNNIGRWFSTGNLLIQTGGTFTDAGYKLDVQGTGRVTGQMTIGSLRISGWEGTAAVSFAATGGGNALQTTFQSSFSFGPAAGTNANSTFIGYAAGQAATNAINSNFLGNTAGNAATNASYSNLFGFQAGRTFTANNIGSNNIIIGTNISLPNGTANSINLGGIIFAVNTYSTTTGDPSIIAQTSGRVSIGTNLANASAILDLTSTTLGFLPPRMTETQKNAISTPATGLVIYQTDGTEGLYQYKSTGWALIAGTGSSAYSVTSVSTTYSETATSGTKIIKADTTGGAFTITLPTAVGNTATIIIKKVAGSASLTIDGAGTETIDGGTTATIIKVYESITLVSDNTNWQIV